MTPRRRRILHGSRNVLLGALALVALAFIGVYFLLRASLPRLDGEVSAVGLSAPVTLTRDERGTVQIAARDMRDAVRALGFVHAQERFFEMDLARRSAAGELSALLGGATLKTDKGKRSHRLRARMEAAWKSLPPAERETVGDYTAGVNAGLAALGSRPWQYWLLRADAEPWREVDSLLLVAEMYFMLQSRGIEERFADIELRKRIGDRVFDWLKPTGGEWDAALDDSTVTPPALPSAAELDTRKPAARVAKFTGGFREENFAGSNNWAVGGALTADGAAILADDMHLGLGVPNIWYRAQLLVGDGAAARRIAGVTLPGAPGVVVGSNGHVAWGFTNSYGQWFDWVALPKVGGAGAHATPLATHREIIAVKGGERVEIEIREAPWGPVLHSDAAYNYALSWSLYREGAVNFRTANIGSATSLDEAIAIAQQGGVPHQNFVAVDRNGNIGWTIMGRIPLRDVPSPGSTRGRLTPEAALPAGWLPAAQYPLVKNPGSARLWTANNRQVGGAAGALIGDGGFDLGARARQIRDRLQEKTRLAEKDLYGIQLDRESRFLRRWAVLAGDVARAAPDDKTAAIAAQLKTWNGQADTGETGHRIARAYRQRVLDQLWLAWLTAADREAAGPETPEKRFVAYTTDGRFEYPAWQAIAARPGHLLPPAYTSWDDFLGKQLDWVHDELVRQDGSLAAATWGKRNTARIGHPFSRVMPFLAPLLDMPSTPLPGDNHMPRVAAPAFGASERLVVSPGHEERGILTMPGGQSGHPLSPYFGAGHDAWLAGAITPLLAGEARHTLILRP
ncbi:MAG: penicillin acylase family protein [Betaproteobacteria bacterium]